MMPVIYSKVLSYSTISVKIINIINKLNSGQNSNLFTRKSNKPLII